MTEYNLTWGMNTPATREKLRELVLYIATKTKSKTDFGSIKINKTLYHSDMASFKKNGRSITGAQYHRIQMGPVPKHILIVERELINEEAMEINNSSGSNVRVAKRKPDTSLFSEDELKEIDEQINRLSSMTSDAVSEDSHDIRWHALKDRDLVPYEFSYLSDELTTRDKTDAANMAERFGW